MSDTKWVLPPDRCFSANPSQRDLARQLFATVKNLPLVCPHGHVAPGLFSNPEADLGTPTELFIIPDHYVFRMLYSQGIKLEDLGIPTRDGTPVESDHRKIWQIFADNFHLFRGTPSGLWLADELVNVFGVEEKLNGQNAQAIYDYLAAVLAQPEFKPRNLFRKFNIETLYTTDAPWDTLAEHQSLHEEGFTHIRPTFRPDGVVNLAAAEWKQNIENLSRVSGVNIVDYPSYIRAIETRRAHFKAMGATSTDQAAQSAFTERLTIHEANHILAHALHDELNEGDTTRFIGHMFMEMARMSTEDGLVMQIHIGSYRNHNRQLYERFGPDKGADIPLQTEWTRNLKPLLDEFGNRPNLTMILFGLDEANYSRELAPIAGHYPAVLLGPPWWFFDSVNGMTRYLDQVMETAGLYNTAGFNDDTRAFASIPARHDVWRRVTCDWLAGMVLKGLIDEADAYEMAYDFAYNQVKRAYKL